MIALLLYILGVGLVYRGSEHDHSLPNGFRITISVVWPFMALLMLLTPPDETG